MAVSEGRRFPHAAGGHSETRDLVDETLRCEALWAFPPAIQRRVRAFREAVQAGDEDAVTDLYHAFDQAILTADKHTPFRDSWREQPETVPLGQRLRRAICAEDSLWYDVESDLREALLKGDRGARTMLGAYLHRAIDTASRSWWKRNRGVGERRSR